jgi:hypothetical protein
MLVAEVELGKIAVQVPLAAMLVDALHPALEPAEVALGRVGVHITADILAASVPD